MTRDQTVLAARLLELGWRPDRDDMEEFSRTGPAPVWLSPEGQRCEFGEAVRQAIDPSYQRGDL